MQIDLGRAALFEGPHLKRISPLNDPKRPASGQLTVGPGLVTKAALLGLKVSLYPVLIDIALFQPFKKHACSAFYISRGCNSASYD